MQLRAIGSRIVVEDEQDYNVSPSAAIYLGEAAKAGLKTARAVSVGDGVTPEVKYHLETGHRAVFGPYAGARVSETQRVLSESDLLGYLETPDEV